MLTTPADGDACYLFALASAAMGRFPAERIWMDRAQVLTPHNAHIRTSQGVARLRQRDIDGAHAAFTSAIARNRNFAAARYQRAIIDLEAMRLASGWADYEWRFTYPAAPGTWRDFPSPLWDGAGPIDGKLLVWAEQSISAQIIFASVLPELELPGGLVVEVDPALVPLFQRSFANAEIVGAETPPNPRLSGDDIAAQIPMGRLCGFRRRAIPDFKRGKSSFLTADADRAIDFMLDLARPEKRTIGLSWRNATRHGPPLTLKRLEPLLRLANTTWVSLEDDGADAEIEAFQAATGIRLKTYRDVDATYDLDTLATLITACDLVVSTDTPVAHLAGGLGRSVWTLLPERRDARWYWFSGHRPRPANFSRWYPSMRLVWSPDEETVEDYVARVSTLLAGAMAKAPA